MAEIAIRRGLSLIGILLAWGITPALAQPQVTHGPIVGAVTTRSARFVLRTDTAASVQIELDTNSAFSNPFRSAAQPAVADSNFFVLISVDGLSPDTQYFYRAVLDGTPPLQTTRSFLTFPPEGTATTFLFHFGSCQQAADDPLSYKGAIFPVMAREKPRFFLQIGDWTYPDTTDGPSDPQNFFNTRYERVQASYRAKYDPRYPMVSLLRIAPVDYVWDDHDFSNNNCDGTYPGKENSLYGYQSMFPHYALANPSNGIWHKFTFGNSDFFMLDSRSQRSPNAAAFLSDSTGKLFFAPGPEHSLLAGNTTINGENQMDWLLRELRASTAAWKFIVSSVPFNPGFRAALELALSWQGRPGFDPIQTPFGPVSPALVALETADKWAGFPGDIQKVVRTVAENRIANVIVLSGDTHTAAIDDGANALFPEIMAGALDRTNSHAVAFLELFGLFIWNRGGQGLLQNNFENAYGRVIVFKADSVRLELVTEQGRLLTRHTVRAGRVTSAVGGAVVPTTLDFSEVKVGESKTQPLIVISNGGDTLHVSRIITGDSGFVASPSRFDVPPGGKQIVSVTFTPTSARTALTTLRLETNDPDGPAMISLRGVGISPTVVGERKGELQGFALEQNYPNPFNAWTQIRYTLAVPSRVRLRIVNIAGQLVRQAELPTHPAGHYTFTWDGKDDFGNDLGSGVYLYQMEAEGFAETRKLLLLR